MCNCIPDIDVKLAEHGQTLNTTILAEPRRAIISLIRKDKWILENRREKPTSFLATYCPWCGEKYPEPTKEEVL
jgi:hypothetical protein